LTTPNLFPTSQHFLMLTSTSVPPLDPSVSWPYLSIKCALLPCYSCSAILRECCTILI